MGTAERPNPSQDPVWPLAEALRNLSCLAELSDRIVIVHMLGQKLGSLGIAEHANKFLHVYSIIEACQQRPDGLTTLVRILERIEQDTKPMAAVWSIVANMNALELWPREERNRLLDLLHGVIVPEIGDIYRRVTGHDKRALAGQTTFAELLFELEALNAEPDGLPKPLVFIEYLATRVRAELASALRGWADRQAGRLGVVTQLQSVRRRLEHEPLPVPSPQSRAYLVLLLRPEGPSGERYRLSHWLQLDVSDGWHPDRGTDDFVGTLAQVRLRVAELAEQTAEAWAKYEPRIHVEFVLSVELLNLEVDQWQWETDSSVPEPVGCRFSVVVRSLDRMKAGKWHGSWRSRWRELQRQLEEDGMIAPGAWHQPESGDFLKLTSVFEQDAGLVSLILADPPEEGGSGARQVLVGLRAGIPVIVWHRRDCGSRQFLDTVDKLFRGDSHGNLLQRARFVRASALAEGADHVGNHLTILWDDPERIVVPQDPGPPEPVMRG
ncbi:MAG TPA: hypothetical protein VFG87_24445 [Amycolatopsis sp.]|jgi:hypothetical protein|nr:hypothetical protein [Amycolatopsis sp.]